MVNRRSKHVQPARNQPDGARDVLYLEWELTVDDAILANFGATVKHYQYFRGPGPYPTYSLQTVYHLPLSLPTPSALSNEHELDPLPRPLTPKLVVPPRTSATASTNITASLSTASSYAAPHPPYTRMSTPPPTPPRLSQPSPPRLLLTEHTPNISSDCSSMSTSPLSSAAPPIPAGIVDNSAKSPVQLLLVFMIELWPPLAESMLRT